MTVHVLLLIVRLLASHAHAILDLDRTSIVSWTKSIRLIVRKPINLQVILVKHCLILSSVCLSRHVVKDSQQHMQGDPTVRTGLMLGSLSHDIKHVRKSL